MLQDAQTTLINILAGIKSRWFFKRCLLKHPKGLKFNGTSVELVFDKWFRATILASNLPSLHYVMLYMRGKNDDGLLPVISFSRNFVNDNGLLYTHIFKEVRSMSKQNGLFPGEKIGT